jgi:acetylornithine deacetylase/succinyl-diaminopimelate desuccinylase family protein
MVNELAKKIRETMQRRIKTYQNEILDFTKALISLPTENPLGSEYKQCANAIYKTLSDVGLECSRHGDCITAYFGTGRRTMYLHGHYDTVPALAKDQFEPYVKNGKLYGRGSSDMKGGLASMIYAVKALKECGIELTGRIGLTIVPDEETGGLRGSGYLLTSKLLGLDGMGMLTPEPTSGIIWNANRGAISLRITTVGKFAHVGLQHQGINAFEQMLTVAQALAKLERKVKRRTTKFKIEPEAAKHSILLLGGRVEGGTNFNAVPAECSFTVDRRINPEEDLLTEKKVLLSVLDELRKNGINLKSEILQEAWSASSSEVSPLARALSQSIEEVQGKPSRFEMCPGLLETRFYARRGVPAYAYGPGLLSVSHGPNEYVHTESIFKCAEIYALTVMRLLTS